MVSCMTSPMSSWTATSGRLEITRKSLGKSRHTSNDRYDSTDNSPTMLYESGIRDNPGHRWCRHFNSKQFTGRAQSRQRLGTVPSLSRRPDPVFLGMCSSYTQFISIYTRSSCFLFCFMSFLCWCCNIWLECRAFRHWTQAGSLFWGLKMPAADMGVTPWPW